MNKKETATAMSGEAFSEVRCKRSIYQVHYGLKKPEEGDEMARPHFSITRSVPKLEIQKYKEQVAGHQKTELERYLGILQCNNGTILKPILKEGQKREIDFYEILASTTNKHLLELQNYVPKYHGSKTFKYNGYESEYVILEDLADGMLEPCIMDVKIGRRTWDPSATDEKIQAELTKYVDSKKEVAFCIPGFQVYKLSTGTMNKYNKDYGKKLNGNTVRDALKIFLNATDSKLCRTLILQFLTELWKIQKWASKQTAVKLYSASLLLVYDTQRLRECCGDGGDQKVTPKVSCMTSPRVVRRRSVHSISSTESFGSNFSGQLSTKGPVYKKIQQAPSTPMTLTQSAFFPNHSTTNTSWHEALAHNPSHSFHNNYDEDLSKIKLSYKAMLDQLSSDAKPKPWVGVKIIDFVHAFFNPEGEEELDGNFSEGIDNVVKIFEEFLRTTEFF